MKRILLLSVSLMLILCMAFGLSGCKKDKEGDGDAAVFELDTSEFNSVVVFGEDLSLAGLKLRDKDGGVVEVEYDMVGHIDTTTVGDKTFEVHFNEQTFTVEYSVKYKVVFVVNGTENEQLVTDISELVAPQPPQVVGKQFERWSMDIPNVLTSNLRIDAIYKTLSSDKEDVYTWSGEGLISLEGYTDGSSEAKLQVSGAGGNILDSGVASIDAATNKIRYNLGTNESITIAISGGEGVMSKSWQVLRVEKPTLSIAGGENAVGIILGGDRSSQKISSSSATVKFKYTTSLSNGNVNAGERNGYLWIEAYKLGVTEVTITATNATNELESISFKHYAVITPQYFVVHNNISDDALESIWTVGTVNADRLATFKSSTISADKIGEGFWENVSFGTSSARVSVSKNGVISFNGAISDPELVKVWAKFEYGNVSVSTNSVDIRCVYGGVNVYNYAELWAETSKDNPNPVVLQSDIKDFSATNHVRIKSTYDTTYYDNVGKSDDAYINVLMQFKNDVYGNGHEINAHNATLGMLDSNGVPKSDSLFKGPLYFVALANGAINVKGQDNIVFAVYDDVTINNVTLKSGDLTISEDGTVDLTELEFAGTTVEVLGDNVDIEYSRLMNGRTVLRIFGDDTDAEKPIHVNIKNTLLKGSREFLARIGSNRFYKAADGTASPLLPGDSIRAKEYYNSKKGYTNWTAEEKAAYDSKYINTFVTMSNLVFEDAGIFAIGMDSHFAGELLNGKGDDRYGAELLKGWHDLAKTSYGAKVTFENDVRIYGWKPIDEVNSKTLIESNVEGLNLPDMTFDVADIIKKTVEADQSAYGNLFFKYGGVDYVHTGIAFFGGGKNYGVIENNISAANALGAFSTYSTRLSQVGKETLEYAAGSEYFHFMVYDGVSDFTYVDQLQLEDKHACLRDR